MQSPAPSPSSVSLPKQAPAPAASAAHASAPAVPGMWPTLTITLAIQAMVAMALLSLPVIASHVAGKLGLSLSWLGAYVAVTYVAAMLASLSSGALVKRFGAIRASQLGLLSCALGLALTAVPFWPVMALGGLFIGAGYGPITPASSHLLAKSTPAHRMSLVFSLKQTGVPLGGLLAGACVPGLALWVGWSAALCVVAGLSVVLVLISQPLRDALDADRQPQVPLSASALSEPIRLVLGQPVLARLAACSFVFSSTQLSLTAYLTSYLTRDIGLGLVLAGLWLSWAQSGGIGGRIVWGYLADRWLGTRWTLVLLALLMAVCALGTAALQPAWPLWFSALVLVGFGASAVGWNGVYLAEVARQAPAGLASMATGGTLAVTFLGCMMGPAAFGLLGAQAGTFRFGYALLALPIAMCALLLWRTPGLGQAPKPGQRPHQV